ncbi:MAG: hypothetical protein GKS00_10790 [Alphaproteobacteria bacterium]|nr:hypothetical protein [Alphaproteobacteria bacterium]
MSGVFFIATLLGIFIVVVWCVKNDKLSDDEPTTGLLAMKHHEPENPEE